MSAVQHTLKLLESLHVCLAFRGELWVPCYWIFWKINCSRLFLDQLWRRALMEETRDLSRISFSVSSDAWNHTFFTLGLITALLCCSLTHPLTEGPTDDVMLLIDFYISMCGGIPFLIYVSEFFHNCISLRQQFEGWAHAGIYFLKELLRA